MNRVVHFEIPADDPESAARFYSEVFGWKIEKWEGPIDYWMVTTGDATEPGRDGGIAKKEPPQTTVTNVIGVESIDEALEKITANGGTVVVPKTAIPGIGYSANFLDTQGNFLGIMESDSSAE
jgi:predicted enzyme related to lactoylglutathione lyase